MPVKCSSVLRYQGLLHICNELAIGRRWKCMDWTRYIADNVFVFMVAYNEALKDRHIVFHIPSPVHTFPSSTNDNTQYKVSADTLGHNYIFWHTLLIFIVSEYLC